MSSIEVHGSNVIFIEADSTHPFTSVTVTEYTPVPPIESTTIV